MVQTQIPAGRNPRMLDVNTPFSTEYIWMVPLLVFGGRENRSMQVNAWGVLAFGYLKKKKVDI